VHGVVAVFHAVLEVLVVGGDVVAEKGVGVFEQGVGVLEVWKGFVVRVCAGLSAAGGHPVAFGLGDPLERLGAAAEEGVEFVLI
jgi:hypothetical protein